MDFNGKLRIEVAPEKNKAGQRPLNIWFMGEGGVWMQVLGARISGKKILEPVAVLSGGKVFSHATFSSELEGAVIKATAGESEEDRQKRITEEMNARARKVGATDE